MEISSYKPHPLGVARRTVGPHGYVAFFPAPIPRSIQLTPETAAVMADAESALGRLDGVTQLLPNPLLLVRPYLVREAVASTRIEGTRASVSDVYDGEASSRDLSPDVEEVVNYIRATEHAVARLGALPVSMRLVCEAHAILLDGVRGRDKAPGQVRRTQNWIGGPLSTLESAAYVPPPPDEMHVALDDWERFVNEAAPGMPVLAQCALMHDQFEAIHPFLDGNGRAGRLLIAVFLISRGRLARPVLYISPYLEQRRDQYIEHLQRVHESGDADPWIRFFCEAVASQANDGVRRARLLVDLREGFRQKVPKNLNAQALVEVLFQVPVLTGRLVEHHLGVTRPTALRLLDQFAQQGVLVERAIGPRSRRSWEASEVIRAISD